MKKRTEPTRKVTRNPVSTQVQWEEAIPRYLQEVEPLNTEAPRSMRFAMLMQELLGFQPDFIESYVSGIEKYLKVRQSARLLRGRADNLFGNIIIEFEKNIPNKLSEAEEQLSKYVAILWSQETPGNRTPYICIATDGVRFVTYSPTIDNVNMQQVEPVDVHLNLLEEADWTEYEPHEVYYWLDRYFLRDADLDPTSEIIVREFGMRSHAFQTSTKELLALWGQIGTHSSFAVIYESWGRYLHIVYGSDVENEELFISHTYLATIAKLMSWIRISGITSLPDEEQILEMLEGRLFKAQGIENFIEEDFFSWLARDGAKEKGVHVVRWLFSLLKSYNLGELSEDVFKSLYQELVDPETRRELGEFYTPDWLAHKMVKKLLDTNPRGAILDPSCGSGTFLYVAIKEIRDRFGDSDNTLNHILESVYGVDVHPLSVIISKTNYLLALGDLLMSRAEGTITIPIYLADSLNIPRRWMQSTVGEYTVLIEGRGVYLPEALLQNPSEYDEAIECAKEFARRNKGRKIDLASFSNFLAAMNSPLVNNDDLVNSLYKVTEHLKHFIDIDRDTIWAFVLKNSYKPLFIKNKFDFIVGNPPWIAYRFLEPEYQKFLKKQIMEKYKLLTKRGELIAHLEIATLFLVRSADIYLKDEGTIAFVLPKSIFTADQHDRLRKRGFKFSEHEGKTLFWREVWDCENVEPLFKFPACVLFADKDEKDETAEMSLPIPGSVIGGKLARKNSSLAEAESALTVEEIEYSLHERGKHSYWAIGERTVTEEASFYKMKFAEGATTVPRTLWFVRVAPMQIGFDTNFPPLETDPRAIRRAKKPYRDVRIEGNIEARFIFATLLSTDLLPFGHLDHRMVVLPIEAEGDRYNLINSDEARRRGFLHLVRWLEIAEGEWVRKRGKRAGKMSIYDRLNHYRGITGQNPEPKYRVLYPKSAKIMCAAVEQSASILFKVGEQSIEASGFLVDYTLIGYETNSKGEAFFLASVLNAPIIDEMVTPLQTRGLWGARDISKKVLELPIPRYDPDNTSHEQLANLGMRCQVKVKQWLDAGGPGKYISIGKLRGMVRELLQGELNDIDELVKESIGAGQE